MDGTVMESLDDGTLRRHGKGILPIRRAMRGDGFEQAPTRALRFGRQAARLSTRLTKLN